MSRIKKIICLLGLCFFSHVCSAANLVEVYQQAVLNDPTFQAAIAQRLVDNEGIPISRAGLLPSLTLQGGPLGSLYYTKTRFSGSATATGATSSRAYDVNLNLTQTVFDYAKIANLAGAKATAKGADATFNSSVQDLMLRVAKAYFQVLQDEDNLLYNESTKLAYSKQLDQVTQQYKVGLKTITDVYTAQASYDSANASYIQAQNTIADDKENLRAITGVYYPSLAKLSEAFPYVTPHPSNSDLWVRTAEQQNWSIKSAQYSLETARQNVKQQFAGHLPTVNLQGQYNLNVGNNSVGPTIIPDVNQPGGSFRQGDRTISLNLALPIFEGGLVVAQTNRAQYQYQVAAQNLEKQVRAVVNSARQSYLGVLTGISKVKADKQAIKSNESSVEGMQEGYRVGTQTLVDVLNQQEKLFQAQEQYAVDRYAYVINLLTLKQAAGTLSVTDLQAINAWLGAHEYAGMKRHWKKHYKKTYSYRTNPQHISKHRNNSAKWAQAKP